MFVCERPFKANVIIYSTINNLSPTTKSKLKRTPTSLRIVIICATFTRKPKSKVYFYFLCNTHILMQQTIRREKNIEKQKNPSRNIPDTISLFFFEHSSTVSGHSARGLLASIYYINCRLITSKSLQSVCRSQRRPMIWML